jgi:hypothetical protein
MVGTGFRKRDVALPGEKKWAERLLLNNNLFRNPVSAL